MEADRADLRSAAAQSFFESLDKLQKTLNDAAAANDKLASPNGSAPGPKPEKSQQKGFELEDLEEAVADIEQFFQSRNPKSTDSKG